MTNELADMTIQRDHWLEIAREKDAEIVRLRKQIARLGLHINALRGEVILVLGTDDFEAVKKGWDRSADEPPEGGAT